MLIDIKIMNKNSSAELGHNDHLKICMEPKKIYVNPGPFKLLFSETTAPIALQFHMQHDKAAGLPNDKNKP